MQWRLVPRRSHHEALTDKKRFNDTFDRLRFLTHGNRERRQPCRTPPKLFTRASSTPRSRRSSPASPPEQLEGSLRSGLIDRAVPMNLRVIPHPSRQTIHNPWRTRDRPAISAALVGSSGTPEDQRSEVTINLKVPSS